MVAAKFEGGEHCETTPSEGTADEMVAAERVEGTASEMVAAELETEDLTDKMVTAKFEGGEPRGQHQVRAQRAQLTRWRRQVR